MTKPVVINVRLEIPHGDLCILADKLDGKTTKREATRKEVNALCNQFISGLVEERIVDSQTADDVWPAFSVAKVQHLEKEQHGIPIDPEDREVLAGKSEGFIRGWYKVKRGTPDGR